MSDPDIVIVGAGAAGIGAGLELQARGIPFVILEASPRAGGRAFADAAGLPRPWDWGCHWLHCADENPLVDWADRLGVAYDRQERDPAFSIWADGALVPEDEIDRADAAITAAFDAIEAAGRQGHDVPIPDILPDAGRWQAGVTMMLGLMAGDDARDVSAAGYADYADTGLNWPVTGGYGTLIARMAEGLPLRTRAPVRRIAEEAGGVRVETDSGTLRARAAIVTASTNVLSAGAIRFGPGPAADMAEALTEIPCGAYEKVAFAMDALPGAVTGKRFLTVQEGDEALSFQVVEGAGPMLICHLAGQAARDLVRTGPAALTDHARAHLVRAFGQDATRLIRGTATTGWTEDPFVRGSYSHARPGAAQLRRDLIARQTGRIGFAGEAFSLRWQATAHGAYQSGRDVAARLAGLARD